jgi:DNA polymerase elongation subunit (family B)
VLEKSSKICVNTIYGLMNQNSSPLFKYECGAGITAFARHSTMFAADLFKKHNFEVLTVDTDGFEIIDNKREFKHLCDKVTETYNYMVLEASSNIKAIFNSRLKSYIKYRPNSGKFELKGCGSKNALQPYFRSYLEVIVKEMFEKNV